MTDLKQCYQATPHGSLIKQIIDPRVPKNEREWAAAREIERLTAELATMTTSRDDYQVAADELAWENKLLRDGPVKSLAECRVGPCDCDPHIEYCDQCAPFLFAAPPAQAWMPIETAPKDGTSIILGEAGSPNVWCDCRWQKMTRVADRWESFVGAVRINPTHWQLKPLPPTVAHVAPAPTLTDDQIDCIPFDCHAEDLADGIALREFARAIEAVIKGTT
jgi:hypothetical protein